MDRSQKQGTRAVIISSLPLSTPATERSLSTHNLWPPGWAIPSSGAFKEMDTKSISWGSFQEKRSKYHSLPIPLKLLGFFLWAWQRVVWGEGGFFLILQFFLSGLTVSAFDTPTLNELTDLTFHCSWVVLTFSQLLPCPVSFLEICFLWFEELRNKSNPEYNYLCFFQGNSMPLDIQLLNCETRDAVHQF